MKESTEDLPRRVPSDEEAQRWANQLTSGLVHGRMTWKRFSKDEWFLEGLCPRCGHFISLPVSRFETATFSEAVTPPVTDEETRRFLERNRLHWQYAFLACNCREGHRFVPSDERPSPGCGFAEEHVVVVPQPELGG